MAENYRITTGGLGACNMRTIPTTMTEEELYNDEHFNFFHTTVNDCLYRLHSRNRKTIRDYHFYQVHCPKCGCLMNEAAPAVDKHILPLYACDICYKD